MYKIIALFFVFLLTLHAQTLDRDYLDSLKKYLLQNSFRLNGKFYYYKIDGIDQWILETLAPDGSVVGYFKLLGKTPTKDNPFGWLKISPNLEYLRRLEPAGYFVYIHYPKDTNNALSWIYIDRKNMSVFKLMDTSAGSFSYLGPLPLYPALFGMEVDFFERGDQIDYTSGVHIELRRLSKSSGGLRYDPRYLKMGSDFVLLRDVNLTSIVVEQRATGRVGSDRIEGTIQKFPLLGVVRIKTKVGNFMVDCMEYYKPLELDTLKRGDDVGKVLQKWGEGGPCNLELVRTTCPAEYYDRLVGCGEKFDLSGLSKNVDFATITRFTINNDLNLTATVYERTVIEPESTTR